MGTSLFRYRRKVQALKCSSMKHWVCVCFFLLETDVSFPPEWSDIETDISNTGSRSFCRHLLLGVQPGLRRASLCVCVCVRVRACACVRTCVYV